MIYVLVRDAQDYDECDQMIFASTSKEKVEAKHDELLGMSRVLRRFAELCRHDMELYTKENPPPEPLKLDNLPLRPLVWNDTRWHNAYVLEHDAEMRKYNDKLEVFRAHLIEQLKLQYDFSKEMLPELEHIWFYLNDYRYSVKEVESD